MRVTSRIRIVDGVTVDVVTGKPLPPLSKSPLLTGAVAVVPDYPAYFSHGSRTMVEGRRARREDLKRTGCRPLESGEEHDPAKAVSQFQREQRELAKERNVIFERQEFSRG